MKRRMTTWDKIAEKEGRIYCRRKDTWCAFVNMKNGSCLRGKCFKTKKEGVSSG